MTVIPGIYQLRIRLRKPTTITIGALGRCSLPTGWYVYTGSARNGLQQRVSRHLRRQKRKHWHIDYLLSVVDCVEAFVWPDSDLSECDLHRKLPPCQTPVAGFGSSDCSCTSHLAYFKRQPKIDLLPWKQFISAQGPPTGRS